MAFLLMSSAQIVPIIIITQVILHKLRCINAMYCVEVRVFIHMSWYTHSYQLYISLAWNIGYQLDNDTLIDYIDVQYLSYLSMDATLLLIVLYWYGCHW